MPASPRPLLRPALLAWAAAAAVSAPVHAQTPPAAATAEPEPKLEQVVVTARKRAEAAQTVPVAISAFNADSLERAKITGAADLQFSIPNAVLTGNDRFTIRGIGNNSLGGDNGVGLAINGATIAVFPQDELFDMERIEVLRGPQGTLFGRNTTGGALALFTKRPTSEFGGSVALELGNYSHKKANLVLNIPFNESLRQRFAVYGLKQDGFTKNLTTGHSIDGRDQYSVRSSTRLFIGDNTEANLVLGLYNEDSTRTRETKRLCKAIALLGCSPTELGFDSPDFASTLFATLAGPLSRLGFIPAGSNIYAGATNPTDVRTVAADVDPSFRIRNEFATLELSHDFESATLTYVGGVSRNATEQNTDWDNATLPFRFTRPITYSLSLREQITTDQLRTTDSFFSTNKTSSHELRLASKGKGPFGYTTGIFHLDSVGGAGFFTFHPFFELIQKVQGRAPDSWYVNTETARATTKAWAWFGEGQWKFADAWRATLGARWTKEDKTTFSRSIVLTPSVPFTEKTPLNWKWWTGRASVDYTPRKDMLLFGTVSTGYKGGGFNAANSPLPVYEPETVTAYELGMKAEYLDGSLRTNLSAFYNDYKNMQLAQRISASAITANADARTSGIEAEVLWAPTRNWLVDANVSLLRTRIGDFFTVDAANPAQSLTATTPRAQVNLNGKKLPHSPETKIKVGAQYSTAVGSWQMTARLDYVWQDDYFAREFNTPTDVIKAWGVTNLQLKFANAKGDVQIKGYVKNLSDANNATNIIIEDALVGSYRNARYLDPRTFGVQVEYRF